MEVGNRPVERSNPCQLLVHAEVLIGCFDLQRFNFSLHFMFFCYLFEPKPLDELLLSVKPDVLADFAVEGVFDLG